jgi:hypothetical protein
LCGLAEQALARAERNREDHHSQLVDQQTEIARLYGMLVLTLEGQQISAITWFGGNNAFPHFGLPRILR